MQRIGIWNTAFLGDTVLTLPLIRAVAAAFPEASLDFYVRQGLGSLFSSQPELTSVYEYDKRGKERGLCAFFRRALEVKRQQYDLWINVHTSLRSAFMAYASHAPIRIGYEGGLLQTLCHTQTVDRRFTELDEIDRQMALLAPILPADFSLVKTFPDLCLSSDRQNSELPAPWPKLALLPAAQDYVKQYCTACHGPRLGLHPGSVWATKRWTPAGFATLAKRAAERGADVFLFATSDEKEVVHEVIRLSHLAGHPCLHNFSGKLNLPTLAAFLACLDCYVTNDSGPMHLAWIQHTPVAALFGPTTRELGFFPRGSESRVFETKLDCRPCGLHGHKRCPKNHHLCMNRINIDEVWSYVKEKLEKPRLTVKGE